MRTYALDSKLDFGKCAGYTVRQVYQFSPTYLEWLIEYTDFYINETDLNDLPNPTPYIKRYPGIVFNGIVSLTAIRPKDCDINFALEHLRSGGSINEIDYKLSAKYFEILEQKKNGIYQVPQNNILSLEPFDGQTVEDIAKQAKPLKIKKKKFDPNDLK